MSNVEFKKEEETDVSHNFSDLSRTLASFASNLSLEHFLSSYKARISVILTLSTVRYSNLRKSSLELVKCDLSVLVGISFAQDFLQQQNI